MDYMQDILTFFADGVLSRLLLAVMAIVVLGLLLLGVVRVPGMRSRSSASGDDELAASPLSSSDPGHH